MGNYNVNQFQPAQISLYDFKKIIEDIFQKFFLLYQQNIEESIKMIKANENQFGNRDIDNSFNNKFNQFVLKTDYSEKIKEIENKIYNLNTSEQELKQKVDNHHRENQKKIEENKNKILSLNINNNNVENLLNNNYIQKNEFYQKINEMQNSINQIIINKNNINELSEEIKKIKSNINEFNKELNNNKSLIEKINQSDINVQLNNVKDSISEINNNLRKIKDTNDQKINEVKNSLEMKIMLNTEKI